MRTRKYVVLPYSELNTIKQFIRGSILGDGYLSKIEGKSKQSRLSFGHSLSQLEYLKWKHSFLSKLNLAGNITENRIISERYKTGECLSYHFKTKSHPIFSYFRKTYYQNNIKTIDRNDISEIDEFGLAVWFMDDASVWNRKGRTSCLVFWTSGFSKSDVQFLINLLYDKWGIVSTFSSENTIRISVKSTTKLIELVSPFLIKEMTYKTVLYKLGEFGGKPKVVNTELSMVG
jgi:hypothetical protein